VCARLTCVHNCMVRMVKGMVALQHLFLASSGEVDFIRTTLIYIHAQVMSCNHKTLNAYTGVQYWCKMHVPVYNIGAQRMYRCAILVYNLECLLLGTNDCLPKSRSSLAAHLYFASCKLKLAPPPPLSFANAKKPYINIEAAHNPVPAFVNSMFKHTSYVSTHALCINKRTAFEHTSYDKAHVLCFNTRPMIKHTSFV